METHAFSCSRMSNSPEINSLSPRYNAAACVHECHKANVHLQSRVPDHSLRIGNRYTGHQSQPATPYKTPASVHTAPLQQHQLTTHITITYPSKETQDRSTPSLSAVAAQMANNQTSDSHTHPHSRWPYPHTPDRPQTQAPLDTPQSPTPSR